MTISLILTGIMIHKWYSRILFVTDLREQIYYGRSKSNRYYIVYENLNSEANIDNFISGDGKLIQAIFAVAHNQ